MTGAAVAAPVTRPAEAVAAAPAATAARILVIKLGALGDFVQATGPFAAIRRHHAGARVTLLTTPPYRDLAERLGLFDAVWVDARPSWWDLAGWWRLRLRLRRAEFDRVYDLQTSDRSNRYFRLMRRGDGGPEWSGIARGCSHPHRNPERDRMHTVDRQADQLRMAGIAEIPLPAVPGLSADVSTLAPAGPYALLVPGGAAHRPRKRWPAARYGALACRLAAAGLTPVILGTAAEAALGSEIRAACPAARDLTGRTGLAEIAALARMAAMAVGNDTGPMHLIAAAGCPAIVLFSDASDPALCAPRGGAGAWPGPPERPAVAVLRRAELAALPVEAVWDVLRPGLARGLDPGFGTGLGADGIADRAQG